MDKIIALILLVIIGALGLVIAAIATKLKKLNNIINKQFNEYVVQQQEEIKKQCSKELSTLKDIENKRKIEEEKLKEKKEAVNSIVEQLETRRQEIIDFNEEKTDAIVKEMYENKLDEYRNELRIQLNELKSQANEDYNSQIEILSDALARLELNLAQAQSEVTDWEARRDAINKDIMRERAIQEQQDFYKVNISDAALADISILLEAKQKLHFSQNLDKLIYDGYVAKPVQEMVKRILEGRAPCGIYKITRLRTGEIYIGKSTDVKSRWQEHCKSCFNVGSIAHSVLHTTMQKDGIQNFTFELIEECPKEKLTEREKFYINLYGSKNYGLNEKVG